jgi:serine protease Do
VTQGQVINPVDHDHFGDWEHDDFIIDAALSSGNSGSPVLAISKRTGEYELVGLFHAEYVSGHGLNAVIGIDQLRDLMFTLKRPARDAQADHRPGTELRAEFVAGVSKPEFVPYLTLGGLTVGVHLAGQNLVYEIFSGTFPADARRLALLVDSPSPTAFGQLASLWTADDGQFTAHDPSRLDSEGQARITDLLRRLHEISSTTMRLRALRARASSSRQAQQDLDQELRAASRRSSSDGDLSQAFSDLVERLSGTNQDSLSYEAVYARLNTPVAPPAATSPTGAASSQGIASTVMAAPSPTTTLGPVPPNSR